MSNFNPKNREIKMTKSPGKEKFHFDIIFIRLDQIQHQKSLKVILESMKHWINSNWQEFPRLCWHDRHLHALFWNDVYQQGNVEVQSTINQTVAKNWTELDLVAPSQKDQKDSKRL